MEWAIRDAFLENSEIDEQMFFCQEWYSQLENSTHFALYSSFKTCLECERYIKLIDKNNFRKALARFRLGVSEINSHRHRFSSSAVARQCPFCPGVLEDEAHVVYICPSYVELRQKYLDRDRAGDWQAQLWQLFSSNDESEIKKFCTFVFLLLEKRRLMVSQ